MLSYKQLHDFSLLQTSLCFKLLNTSDQALKQVGRNLGQFILESCPGFNRNQGQYLKNQGQFLKKQVNDN